MPVIITRPRAEFDLIEIWDYIAEDSETQADTFIDAIDRKFHILAERPNLGRPRAELAEGLRSFPIGRYIIFIDLYPMASRLSAFCTVHEISTPFLIRM